MPIEITCPKCQKKLRAPDSAEGKKVKCPQCQDILVVPGGSAPTIALTPGAPTPGAPTPSAQSFPSPSEPKVNEAAVAVAAPGDRWYVKTRDGIDYGPVAKADLDAWVRDRRLDAECQVLRDGASQWQWASDLYPHLEQGASGSPAPLSALAAPPSPVAPAWSPSADPFSKAEAPGPFDFLAGGGAGSAPEKPAITPAPQSYPAAPAAAGGYTAGYSTTPMQGGAAPFPGSHSYSQSSYGAGADYAGLMSDKSKLVAGLLGIFLGGFGVHRFYLGYIGIGFAQIGVTLLTCGLGGWWGIIEGIMILVGSIDRDANGRKLRE